MARTPKKNENKEETLDRPSAVGVSESLTSSVASIDHLRLISLYDDVDNNSIAAAVNNIVAMSSLNPTLPIQMMISTYGGVVTDMFALYDIMKMVQPPIHTIGIGKIMSAGNLILAAGKKGERQIGKHTEVMLHPVSGGVRGTVFQMSSDVDNIKNMQKKMVKALSVETGASIKKLNSIMEKGHDHYITAEEAIDLGLADKIIGE